MSIIAYVGLPGAGKSYNAVANFILPALAAGRTVAHNLVLNDDECLARTGGQGRLVQIPAEGTADDVIKACPPGAAIVIDEIWRYWPAGVSTAKVPRDQLSFFKEHRQRRDENGRTSEILIIDQSLNSAVSRWIRDLVEYTYIHSKLTAVGANNRYRVDVYERAQDGEKPRQKEFRRALYGSYKPEIYSCYQSHAKETAGDMPQDVALEERVDKRNTVFGSFRFKAGVAALCILPLIFWYISVQFSELGSKPATKERVATKPDTLYNAPASRPVPSRLDQPVIAGEVSPPRVTPVPPAPPTGPQEHGTWRLLGVIAKTDGTGYAHLVSAHGKRRISLDTCSQDDAREWTCELDGKIVGRWTGTRVSVTNVAAVPGTYSSQ